MTPLLKLRGHHLICLHFFSGEGYSPEFVENLREILRESEDGKGIEVCKGADEVCKKCPYLKEEKCFYSLNAEAGIREMDRRAVKLLGVKIGDRINWMGIWEKVPAIFVEWAKEYCNDCDWRKVCERTIKYKRLIKR
ncbi:MAG: hypothetical protein A2Y97_10230 [Nitrospirae bacterium RBG_13_39_12]|nr:MAG: hypothetical protein A2Y97_10230 [Nitrospirae bacterium RBG_13_39_12]